MPYWMMRCLPHMVIEGAVFMLSTAVLQEMSKTCGKTCGDFSKAFHCQLKRKRRKTKTLEQQARYEKEGRKHSFLTLWQTNRPWLKYMQTGASASQTTGNNHGAMFCQICQDTSNLDKSVQTKIVFVQGCTSQRLESIKFTKHRRTV